MADDLLYALALLYVAFATVDVYVAGRFVNAARIRPFIPALTGMAVSSSCVAVGGILGAVLGVNGVWRALTGATVLPTTVTLLLLVAALGVPSLGKVYLLSLIRAWDRSKRGPGHPHRRADDDAPKYHRRATDPPQDGEGLLG